MEYPEQALVFEMSEGGIAHSELTMPAGVVVEEALDMRKATIRVRFDLGMIEDYIVYKVGDCIEDARKGFASESSP